MSNDQSNKNKQLISVSYIQKNLIVHFFEDLSTKIDFTSLHSSGKMKKCLYTANIPYGLSIVKTLTPTRLSKALNRYLIISPAIYMAWTHATNLFRKRR